MLLELSQLPQVVQQQILTAKANDIIQIVNNGELVKTAQFNEARAEELYFDIDEMQKAIASPSVEIPKSALKDLASFEQFLKASFV